ncbi:MFS transporter [Tistrella bauzanensis]
MSESVTTASPAGAVAGAGAWWAVLSMALGVFGLVTAEFLPASLLTPMAADLGVTEGLAGQAVTATAAVGLVTSLVIAAATRRIDRRFVLLGFTGLLVASNLLVAVAPDLGLLIAARVLLGVALGGFWTMSAATVMRLVPEAMVPKALSMVFAGVSRAIG